MAALPWLPWYVDDWLTSPTRIAMTPTERAIYMDLLSYQWKNGFIPADHQALAIMAAVPLETFEAAAPSVLRNFSLKEGQYRNQRLDTLRRSQNEKRTIREEKSRKGGIAKANRLNQFCAPSTLQAGSKQAYARSDSVSVSDSSGFSEQENSGVSSPPTQGRTPTGDGRLLRPSGPAPQNGSPAPQNGNGSPPANRNGHPAGNPRPAPLRSPAVPAYDPGPAWERFRDRYPNIRSEDAALQDFLAVVTGPEIEAEVFSGLERWEGSNEWHRGIYADACTFLRGNGRTLALFRGKPAPYVSEAEREERDIRKAVGL